MEAERYSILYYLYIHTSTPDERRAKNPVTGNDLLSLCDQTSPILLRLKEALTVSSPDEFNAKAQEGVTTPVIYSSDMLDTFEPMTATEFNNPGFDTGKDSYPGYLHRVSIDNATPLYKGETINGKQVVTIGYRRRAIYTYAIPSAKALGASEATPRSYDTLPEGTDCPAAPTGSPFPSNKYV